MLAKTFFLFFLFCLIFTPRLAYAQNPKPPQLNMIYSQLKSSFQKDFNYLEDTQSRIQKRIDKNQKNGQNMASLIQKAEEYPKLKSQFQTNLATFIQKPSLSTTLTVRRDLQQLRSLEVNLLKLLSHF